jgi:quaternary ammonium compound-resistance protein SugE
MYIRTREESSMAWILLFVAAGFETAMAISLKFSDGFSRLWPSVGFAVTAVISFALLSLALRELEVGTAYATWTGLGAAGTALVGILALHDSASPLKLASIGLVILGVIGLNVAGGH